MLAITDHSPAYIHTIRGYDLPDWMYQMLRDDALEYDYKMLDYQDGDFKYKLSLKIDDPTPVSELVKFQEGEEGYDETTYPYNGWVDDADDGNFDKYIGMLLIQHHVRANVPPHVVATDLLAVSI
jgi:hypothetical protein